MKLPHQSFNRQIGEFSTVHADPSGNVLSDDAWEKRKGEFLPSGGDKDFIEGLMQPEIRPGKFASWIAPPKVGIDNKSGDFEYVKLA
jgi:benzoyl-CoA 2,3-dioxygenase component B